MPKALSGNERPFTTARVGAARLGAVRCGAVFEHVKLASSNQYPWTQDSGPKTLDDPLATEDTWTEDQH